MDGFEAWAMYTGNWSPEILREMVARDGGVDAFLTASEQEADDQQDRSDAEENGLVSDLMRPHRKSIAEKLAEMLGKEE
jgi:hypothetical protein